MAKPKKKTKSPYASPYFILPLTLIITIVPLIVYMKIVPITHSAVPFWKGGNVDYDFFSYNKMTWFMIFVGVSIVTLFVKLAAVKHKIKKTFLYIPMAVYSAFAILSALVSKEPDVSLWGFPDRYEGIFVLLAYMVVLFIVINLLDNEKQIKILLGGLFISSLVIGLIAFFQYFNMDLFQTDFGKKLMLPAQYWSMAKNLKFSLGPRAAYGTLYHTNYVGSFTAMVFPLALALFLLLEKIIHKIIAGAMAALMFFDLIASHSRAGIIGVVVSAILLVILTRKKLIRNWKFSIGLIGSFVIIIIAINIASKGAIISKIGTLYNDSSQSQTSIEGITDINVNKNIISFTDANGVMNVSFKMGKINVTDENNKIVPVNYDETTHTITFSQKKFIHYKLRLLNFNNNSVIQVNRGDVSVNFIPSANGFKLLDNNNQIHDIVPIPRWGFKGNENLGSARGYIWSRSLPLLKNTIIAGYGPDTFAIHFPQNDYIGKLFAYNDTTIIVDKPHNIYLQAALNTGVISLLALLALFGMYFATGIRIYFKMEFNDLSEIVGVGLLAAVCGYLFAGLFNDSTISVAPVFWVLLGSGIGINLNLMKKKLKQ